MALLSQAGLSTPSLSDPCSLSNQSTFTTIPLKQHHSKSKTKATARPSNLSRSPLLRIVRQARHSIFSPSLPSFDFCIPLYGFSRIRSCSIKRRIKWRIGRGRSSEGSSKEDIDQIRKGSFSKNQQIFLIMCSLLNSQPSKQRC